MSGNIWYLPARQILQYLAESGYRPPRLCEEVTNQNENFASKTTE
jgi:hypothetical protein